MAFIAREKTSDHYEIVNALPGITIINGEPSGAEWEAISITLSYEEAQQLLAEILIAAEYTPSWQTYQAPDGLD